MSILQQHAGMKGRSDLNWCEPKVEIPPIRDRGFWGLTKAKQYLPFGYYSIYDDFTIAV